MAPSPSCYMQDGAEIAAPSNIIAPQLGPNVHVCVPELAPVARSMVSVPPLGRQHASERLRPRAVSVVAVLSA